MPRFKSVLGAVGAMVLAGSLAACGGGGSAASDSPDNAEVTFVGYGGQGQDAMIASWQEPYTAEHSGVTFANTSPPDVAQVKAQVEAGAVSWDVVAVAPAAAQEGCGELFEEIDYVGVPESELADQTVGDCYVGGFINSTPLAYRTDAFPDPSTAPKTVADFFDTENFPGQRGILTNLQNGILEYPLLADGVAIDDLYPLDLDRSLDVLDTIRDTTTFAPNVGALEQAVGSGQVDMFFLSDSRISPLLDQGVDITVVWDQTVTTLSAFAVPKNAPHAAAAEQFVSSLTSASASASISEGLGTAPVNTTARPSLKESQLAVQVYGPVNTGETVMQDVDWYAENYNDVTTRLTNWLAG